MYVATVPQFPAIRTIFHFRDRQSARSLLGKISTKFIWFSATNFSHPSFNFYIYHLFLSPLSLNIFNRISSKKIFRMDRVNFWGLY